MDFAHFVSVVTADKPPELADFERVSVFADAADRDALWAALGRGGVHPVYQAVLAQALQRRILLEKEEDLRRAREEDLRREREDGGKERDDEAARRATTRRRAR